MIWTGIALAGITNGVLLGGIGMALHAMRRPGALFWMQTGWLVAAPCAALLLWRYLVA